MGVERPNLIDKGGVSFTDGDEGIDVGGASLTDEGVVGAAASDAAELIWFVSPGEAVALATDSCGMGLCRRIVFPPIN